MAHENVIGEYLRARRELVGPEDVGIPNLSSRRRVSGLRREEVAMLAGVSSDYYVRLEQGRDQHPPSRSLTRWREPLQLDDDRHRPSAPPRYPAGPVGAAAAGGPRRCPRASCS